jgi:hypothetical protein
MNPQSPYPQGGQAPYQPQPQPQPVYQQPYPPQPVAQPAVGYSPTPPPPRKKSKVWVILTFVFIFTTICAACGGAWALINYFDQKDNVDSKVTAAVATAVKEQQDKDAADFLEKEKQPNRQFAGPDDYGRLSFDYPKTWSIYVANDATNGNAYEAYFNPVSVPEVNNTQRFALRVTIKTVDYDQELKTYERLVKEGALKSSSVTADGQNGTRLDGNFTKDIKGSAVLFKIRDKTVTMRTDADTFNGDFGAILKTITFNK